MDFIRPQAAVLARRLEEPRRFIQAVAGPRQVGKTTLVGQVTQASGLPTRYASADASVREVRRCLQTTARRIHSTARRKHRRAIVWIQRLVVWIQRPL